MGTWKECRLRHYISVDPHTERKSGNPDDAEVSFFPMEAIGEDGTLDLSRSISPEAASNGLTACLEGDVLLAKVTPCFENGKGAIARGLRNGIGLATTEVYALRTADGLDPRFLEYRLRSLDFRQYGTSRLTGAGGLKRLSSTDLKNFKIMLPTENEQRAIADFLDRETSRIDALIVEQEKLIQLFHERLEVSWEKSLPNASEKGGRTKLRRVIESIVDGPFGSSLTSRHYSEQGTRVIRLGNIGVNKFVDTDKAYIPTDYADSLAAHEVRAGDVVLAGLGDDRMPLGRATVVPNIGPAIVKADCYRIRTTPQVIPDYLAWALCAPQTRKQIALLARGATRARLNTSVVQEVTVPVPTEEVQKEIVGKWNEQSRFFDALIAETEKFIELSRERRAALITAAVTGQIDVRKKVA